MENWKRTVYLLTLCNLCMALGFSQVGPIMPIYFHHMGVESAEELSLWSGLASGVTYLVVCFCAPFWGRLADRKGRKITLIRSSLGMALCNLALGFAATPETVVIIRALQGVVNGFNSAAFTLLVTQVPEDRTGWSLGILSTGQMSGTLLGPLIGGYIASTFGIRNDFLLIGTFMLIAFFIIMFFIKEDFTPEPNQEKQSFSTMKAHIPHFNIVLSLYVASFIFAICAQALQPIITVYIKGMVPPNTSNLPLIAGAVFSCTGIAQLLSTSNLGKLVDRVGPRKILIISLIYVGLLNIPQAYVDNVYLLGLVRFLQGLGMGGLLPALNAFLSRQTPKAYTGQVFAYNQSCLFLGYFLGSIGGAGLMASLGFTALFWISALLFVFCALWIAFRVPAESSISPSVKE